MGLHRLIGAGAQEAVLELKAAQAIGMDAIEKINQTKHAIEIFSALVDLAVAVLAKNAQGVVAASNGVRAACKGFSKGGNAG